MVRALLFATFVLLCLDLSLAERTRCYSCLMNYPGSGCVTGGRACSADLDRGQNCITLHFFHGEQELLRVQGCTRPGIDVCGTEQKSGTSCGLVRLIERKIR
ncbi:Hypothetical predicted protein [Podarcis lilfordi]|uniref:UPAR/Ly6 domain-containing protein n=1 Tax=Podarcis lilfordi TaxID=74358 RepID=A0AA35JZZ7_9SAUR|nr:Hypothetical predicted protein [Podarcis lilfordi]